MRAFLESLHARYHRREYLAGDPLLFAHRYDDPADREIVALLAAALAFGNIRSILASLEALLPRLGGRPAAWLKEARPADLKRAGAGLYHRWVKSEDIAMLLGLFGEALRAHGSLGALWRRIDDPAQPDTWQALERFCEAIVGARVPGMRLRQREGMRSDGRPMKLASVPTTLLASPARGSACKRMHLFLRWMARPADGIDLGLWTDHLSPVRLVMPIDTHVLSISQRLGFTRQQAANRRAAEEITDSLRRLAPGDPCRYDFALVRAGIDDLPLG